LLSYLAARLDFRQPLRTPEIAKQLDRRRPISRVMIVCERVDQHALFRHLIAKIDSAAQFGRAVNSSFVPYHSLFFDCFAIAKPAYVGQKLDYYLFFDSKLFIVIGWSLPSLGEAHTRKQFDCESQPSVIPLKPVLVMWSNRRDWYQWLFQEAREANRAKILGRAEINPCPRKCRIGHLSVRHCPLQRSPPTDDWAKPSKLKKSTAWFCAE